MNFPAGGWINAQQPLRICRSTLSPRTWSGRVRGLPGPAWLIFIWAIRWVNMAASPLCPGATGSTKGLPLPSTRAWILVLNPPRDRRSRDRPVQQTDSCNSTGPLWCGEGWCRAGGHGSPLSRLRLTSPLAPGSQQPSAGQPGSFPMCHRRFSGDDASRSSATDRSRPGCPVRRSRTDTDKGCPPPPVGRL